MKKMEVGQGVYVSMPAFALACFLAFTLLVAGIWDVYALFALTPVDTVSFCSYRLVQEYPPAALLLGLIVGHILWPLHITHNVPLPKP